MHIFRNKKWIKFNYQIIIQQFDALSDIFKNIHLPERTIRQKLFIGSVIGSA